MEENNISVALCTYNGAAFLREQLESIFNQSVAPSEIILCDDRSVDGTIQIAEMFRDEKKVNIKIFTNEVNLGVTKNFERALGLCSGDIIFLSDQDDIWEPGKVKKIVEYFEMNTGKNVVFTNAHLLENGKKISDTAWDKRSFNGPLRQRLADPEEMLRHLLMSWNLATGATMAVRRKALKRYLPFPQIKKHLQDHILALQAATENALGFIDECLITYRLHDQQQLGFRLRTVPAILQPLYKAAQKIKKILVAGRRKKEKQEVARALRKYITEDFPQAKNVLNI